MAHRESWKRHSPVRHRQMEGWRGKKLHLQLFHFRRLSVLNPRIERRSSNNLEECHCLGSGENLSFRLCCTSRPHLILDWISFCSAGRLDFKWPQPDCDEETAASRGTHCSQIGYQESSHLMGLRSALHTALKYLEGACDDLEVPLARTTSTTYSSQWSPNKRHMSSNITTLA